MRGAGAIFRAVALMLLMLPAISAAQDAAVLTTARQLRELGPHGARHEHPAARLKGVVTFYGHNPRTMVWLQDATGSALVLLSPNVKYLPQYGDNLEVEGTVHEAGMISALVADKFTVSGKSDLPPAHPLDLSHDSGAEAYSDWVSLRGHVRDMALSNLRLVLLLSQGGHLITVYLFGWSGKQLPVELMDAEVEVTGIYMRFMTLNPGLPRIEGHAEQALRIIHLGQADYFGRPLRYCAELENSPEEGHRVKIAGTLLLREPGGTLFVRDGTGTARVQLLEPQVRPDLNVTYFDRIQDEKLEPGDPVEIVGVPHSTGWGVSLTEADCRRTGRGSGGVAAPRAVTAAEAMTGSLHGQFVTLRGHLLDRETHSADDELREESLVLRDGDTVFEAAWKTLSNATLPESKSGYAEVTGLCEVVAGDLKQVRSFRLHLRGPEDVRAIAAPAFWQRPEIMKWLGLAVLGTALAGVWIGMLRRQVHRRTAQLAEANASLTSQAAERHTAQEKLAAALESEREASQLKSRFISTVSHEFRTPLAVILSSSQLLEAYLDRLPPERRAKHFTDITGAVKSMSGLVDEVLDLSRVESTTAHCAVQACDLAALIHRFTDEVRSATAGRAVIEVQNDVSGPVHADPGLLRYILVNLLSNAVKYSPPDAPVTLRVHREPGNLFITVTDRGIGIPANDQHQLFQPFFRGSNVGETPGTGLGLLIVKRSVELHGGTLDFTSSDGTGTTFSLNIPQTRPAQAAAGALLK